MHDVVLLTLDGGPPGPCGSACAADGAGGPSCAASGAGNPSREVDDAAAGHAHRCVPGCGGGCDSGGSPPRAAVLACRDALIEQGATVELITAGSDQDIDAVLTRLDGPLRADGLTWPRDPGSGGTRLIVASGADGQVRAVLRRMVRRYAPPPSRRPADLPDGRTVPDLPPIAILPLDRTSTTDLAARLGLPRDPRQVAAAALHGQVRRLDLLRNDGGSVTLHGAFVGPGPLRVDVDDTVLATASDQLLACAVANADGYATVDGLPLAPEADPADGLVTVAVAVAVVRRSLFARHRVRVEVRRVRGRAVAVTPTGEAPLTDDGVAGTLTRRRTWWTEPAAWGVLRP